MSATMSDAVQRVPVPLGDRAYDVLIGPGLVARAGALIAERFPAARCGIVTDETVAKHHLGALEKGFASGKIAGSAILPPGAATKSVVEVAALS
jgi:3-dehydroquinate synthetase